nr:hypothetical protein [Tanacetum cinerariifolium]
YLRYGNKGSRLALSISKMKAAYYHDVGLEEMVPNQMWIEEECKYYIASIAVRTHTWILSVVRIEVFSMYGYDYIKKIVLRRADLNEHIIVERDFKYLYPSNFEDLYLLNLQDTIDSASVFAVLISLSASEGLSLKNKFPKLRSFARCCREDKVPVELAGSSRITCSSTVSLRFSYTFGYAVAVSPLSICSG